MSYNGIGLRTAKGSSTNGFVQKNYTRNKESSYARKMKLKKDNDKRANEKVVEDLSMIKDPELLKYEEKRTIELKVSEFRDTLEDQDELDDDEIEKRCKEFRKDLLKSRPEVIINSYKKREDRNKDDNGEQKDVTVPGS